MKKPLLILLCFPMIGFGQDTVFIPRVDTVYITVDNNENSTLNKQNILLDDSEKTNWGLINNS